MSLNLLLFLNARLNVIEYFHANTTAAFEEVKRKIEAGEPPYVDRRHPEDGDDEPAFIEEWEKADAAMKISGAACLDTLQSTLHEYLNQYMDQIGSKQVIPRLKKMGKQGWFRNYQEFFSKFLHIDWTASGADLDLIEQVILTRNDFAHNIDFISLSAFQTNDHAHKHANSAFVDPRWKAMFFGKYTRLIVPAATLQKAIDAVRALAGFLEPQRHALLRRWRAERKDSARGNPADWWMR